MKKKLVKLTENDLHKIIENTVKRVIKEEYDSDSYPEKVKYLIDTFGCDDVLSFVLGIIKNDDEALYEQIIDKIWGEWV